MNFTRLKRTSAAFVLFASGLVNHASASLIEVQPISYVFDKATQSGKYAYHDITGNELIDGLYGSNIFEDDLGHGPANEWVGWGGQSTVNIDFTLNQNQTINSIAVGSIQDKVTNVVLPNMLVFSRNSEQASWSLLAEQLIPESVVNNGFHHTYNFDELSITDQFVRVQANWNLDGPWTFIDEVDFYIDEVNVSEPSTFAIFLLGTLAIGVRRFKKSH